jgi:hypothetical protein
MQTTKHVPFRLPASIELARSEPVQFDNTLVKTLRHLAANLIPDSSRAENGPPASQKTRHMAKHMPVRRLGTMGLLLKGPHRKPNESMGKTRQAAQRSPVERSGI